MRINNNIPALNTHRLLNINTNALGKTLERLSSGKRINKASDDAAGLAISQKMEAQVKGLRQASRNSLDGISLIQTAEGALNEVHAMLQRMRELSVQGANGVYEDGELEAIHNEIEQLTEQIDKIAEESDFNGIKLLDGSKKDLKLQIGANEGQSLNINMAEFKVDTTTLGINGIVSSSSQSEDYSKAIEKYNTAIQTVSSHRSKLGAYQNRLEHTIRNVDNTAENLTAAKSRIEDVDMALEMSEFTKLNILQQAGTNMLGQANQLPQTVLQLLK
ncbi:flagellin [Tissierella sp. MSJ-40]|uniref:Flagellin n=1 Tax=Tissierella simiarum TaxID=2841534 RepID=A0ABS6E4I0_9FIRM|nr:flagellin [Tissierella simiarum]MBU5437168.1 flagellin [Tissierella simiarum]